MSHFVAYILQFQEIIVYKIPPGGRGGSIASLRSTNQTPRSPASDLGLHCLPTPPKYGLTCE